MSLSFTGVEPIHKAMKLWEPARGTNLICCTKVLANIGQRSHGCHNE